MKVDTVKSLHIKSCRKRTETKSALELIAFCFSLSLFQTFYEFLLYFLSLPFPIPILAFPSSLFLRSLFSYSTLQSQLPMQFLHIALYSLVFVTLSLSLSSLPSVLFITPRCIYVETSDQSRQIESC